MIEASSKDLSLSRQCAFLSITRSNLYYQSKGESPLSLTLMHLIEDKGKLSWQNQMNYGRRSTVENTMHRYKTLIGNKLRSKTFESQITETKIAVQVLNQMRNLCVSKVPLAA